MGPNKTPTMETATAPPTREGMNQTMSSSLVGWDYGCDKYRDWYKYTLSQEMRKRIARGVHQPVITVRDVKIKFWGVRIYQFVHPKKGYTAKRQTWK